jgi:hypothetical protein
MNKKFGLLNVGKVPKPKFNTALENVTRPECIDILAYMLGVKCMFQSIHLQTGVPA